MEKAGTPSFHKDCVKAVVVQESRCACAYMGKPGYSPATELMDPSAAAGSASPAESVTLFPGACESGWRSSKKPTVLAAATAVRQPDLRTNSATVGTCKYFPCEILSPLSMTLSCSVETNFLLSISGR